MHESVDTVTIESMDREGKENTMRTHGRCCPMALCARRRHGALCACCRCRAGSPCLLGRRRAGALGPRRRLTGSCARVVYRVPLPGFESSCGVTRGFRRRGGRGVHVVVIAWGIGARVVTVIWGATSSSSVYQYKEDSGEVRRGRKIHETSQTKS